MTAADLQGRTGAVVVIGAGQAGGRTAEALRLGGYSGPVTIIGDEPHPPYERPSLSKEFLHTPELAKIAWIRPTTWYANTGVTLLTGRRATRIRRDRGQVELEDGATID